jgi:hypothetical protein
MKLLFALPPLALALVVGGQSVPTQTTSVAARSAQRVPVVLELFTSEGCSSCPPADALLAKLAEQQPVPGADVIALEEHVDYWDSQGWTDRFSSAQWTQRQQDYSQRLADHGVYTPELVVNGRFGLVGSREGETYRVIAGAVAQPYTEVSVSLAKSEKNSHEVLKVEVGKLSGVQQGDTAEVWLAITETGLHSPVGAGENAGRDLRHAPVVRWLHKAGTTNPNSTPAFTGESELKLDSSWKKPNLRAVAFVQEKRSRHILGAAAIRFEE